MKWDPVLINNHISLVRTAIQEYLWGFKSYFQFVMGNTLSGRSSPETAALFPAAGFTKKYLDARGLYRTKSLASERVQISFFSPKGYLYFVPRFAGQTVNFPFLPFLLQGAMQNAVQVQPTRNGELIQAKLDNELR